MGKVIVVTGGSRSGKSEYAEEIAKAQGEGVAYIATGVITDDEMRKRVDLHVVRRPKEWVTIEAYKNLDTKLEATKESVNTVLLDCVSVMTTNFMFDKDVFDNPDDKSEHDILEDLLNEISKLIGCCKKKDYNLIVVCSEVGMGIVPESKVTRIFRDLNGKANQYIAKKADEVYMCVSGIPLRIK